MTTETGTPSTPREPELLGQTVVLIGGSAGIGLEARREELRTTLPTGRDAGPQQVTALAVHLMTNRAVTGATYDIDGGQQFVS
jgi:NAD(P)-dependent dehydrogenase (short-subunit alcohol dehydrogenase family)